MERANIFKGMLLVLLVTTVAAATSSVAPTEDEDYDEFIPYDGQRFDGFDWRLCQEVNDREPGNVVVSPVGLKLVLVMLYEATKGSSASELHNALQLPQNRFLIRDTFSTIITSLQERKSEYVFNIGSKMYLDKSLTPSEKYIKLLTSYYGATIQSIDFHKSSVAMSEINTWVSNVTNGNIKQMINDDSKLSDTMLLLLNAIYFKGTWRYPFKMNDTATGTFYVTPKHTVSVNYMKQTEMLYYSESKELDAKILRLPYLGKKYSMFLVLPNTVNGFDRMLNIVNPLLMREQLSLMTKEEVGVILPRFKFDYTTYLKDILKKLGIREVFSANAKLAMTNDKNQLAVSDILQKVGLEVNEQGTTAWGGTEMSMVNKIGGSIQIFNASHPFMIFIEEEKSGTVVFIGKVVDPTHAMSFRNHSFAMRMNDLEDVKDSNPFQPDEHKFVLPQSLWRYITSGQWLRRGNSPVYEKNTPQSHNTLGVKN